ncbi:aminotransferase class I/II-fold pyridoxal phosphate-dependent enzyme [Flavobacteriaceae bacterium D16]|nr:aminotransferase class I/II-fold pyridoxal phosphate-dependent enzyme [Flavobacteriaceae bacterium D16]
MTKLLDQFPGPRFNLEGKPHLYFGGTAYLGLQSDPEFQKCFMNNISRYGTHYGASRNANVQIAIYSEAEQQLKEAVGAEAALTLSSGYLAGQLLANYFNHPDYTLFYTRESHAALYQGKTPAFSSYNKLKEDLKEHLSTKKTKPVLFIDTMENKEASYPCFEALKDLPLSHCILIADDSHGFGVMGSEGRGAFSILAGLKPRNLLVCFSLGKAIGIPAGAVVGSKEMINKLAKTEFYGAASPANPAGLATLIQSWELIQSRSRQLQNRVNLFLSLLENPDVFHFIPSQPAFGYRNPGLTDFLKKHNILLTHFHYPNEDSEPTSRIVLTAAHSEKEIRRLAQLINLYFQSH